MKALGSSKPGMAGKPSNLVRNTPVPGNGVAPRTTPRDGGNGQGTGVTMPINSSNLAPDDMKGR